MELMVQNTKRKNYFNKKDQEIEQVKRMSVQEKKISPGI